MSKKPLAGHPPIRSLPESAPTYADAPPSPSLKGNERVPQGAEDSLEAVTNLAESLCYVADESLRESPQDSPALEEHFREIADASPTCLWLSDPQGGAYFVSRWWHEFTGQSVDESLGRGWVNAIHPDDHDQVRQQSDELHAAGATFSVEYRLRRKDGEYHWMLALARPRLDENGKVLGFIGSLTDIHEAKQAAARLEAQNAELLHMARLSTMGQMVAAVSHELSQPLNAIGNYAGACQSHVEQKHPDDEELRSNVQELLRQTDRAREILRRLREFARKKSTRRVSCVLNTLIEDSLVLMEHELQRQNLHVDLEATDRTLTVMADRVQIQQVVVNLLFNARDALLAAAPENRWLSLRLYGENGWAVIEVEDRGPGIAAEVLGRLFEPFVTTKETGMGLGLSICRTIVEAHGGTITAKSSPQVTCLRVQLPLIRQ